MSRALPPETPAAPAPSYGEGGPLAAAHGRGRSGAARPALHLTAADFDAYLPERASSNAYTRPRLELKQRMLAWAHPVLARLAELGIAACVTGSDEHPNVRNGRKVECQRVFFWRDAAARAELERLLDRKRSLAAALGDPAPHKNHAYLALRVDSALVEVGIEVHPEAWVDMRNLRARLSEPGRALELTTALEVLPDQFSLGLSRGGRSGSGSVQAQRASTDEMRDLLDEVEAPGALGEQPLRAALWLGWSVPRDTAVAHSELLDEQLEDAIVALGPVFKLVAWSRENDLLVLDREWAEAKAERARAHEQAERDQAEWEAKRERSRPQPRAQRGWPERAAPPPSAPARAREAQPKAVAEAPEPARAEAPNMKRPATRPAKRPRIPPRVVSGVDPSAPIERGTKIEVLCGPFEGKLGVVQELDGKGGARVLLGLLAMRLLVKDLAASVDGRPLLSSSHRKPR